MNKRFFLTCVASFAFIVSVASPSYSAEKYGVISRIKGSAQVRRSGDKTFKTANARDFLYLGDAIRTARNSMVAILSSDGTEIKINQSSFVILDRVLDTNQEGFTRKVRSVFVQFGQTWMKLLKAKRPESTAIRTNIAVCAVRGTEFSVNVGKKNMDVAVLEGVVNVYNGYGQQNVEAGQGLSVGAGSAPETPHNMRDDEKPDWQDDITVSDEDKDALSLSLQSSTTTYASEPLEKTLHMDAGKDGKSAGEIKIKFKKE